MNKDDKLPVNKVRNHWLDAGRGIAISATIFVHMMRWLLLSFAAWKFSDSSFANWEVGVVRGLEGYLRMCWISVFAFSIILTYGPHNFTPKWLLKRFVLLIVFPTAVWCVGYWELVFRWEIIQSLFIYNVAGLLLYSMRRWQRWLIYAATIAFAIYVFPARQQLANENLFWALMVGGLTQNNYFNILYGFPAFFFFFELYKLAYDRERDHLNLNYLYVTTGLCLAGIAAVLLTGYNSIEPRHYPPQIIEYLTSFAFTNCCHIYLFTHKQQINPRGFLTILGRYSWIHFLGHLFMGVIIFEWLGLFKQQFSFPVALGLTITLLLVLWKVNVAILNYRIKKGYDLESRN